MIVCSAYILMTISFFLIKTFGYFKLNYILDKNVLLKMFIRKCQIFNQ